MSNDVTAAIKDGKLVIEVDISGVDLQRGPARIDTSDREIASTPGGRYMTLGNGLSFSLKVKARCLKSSGSS